MKLLKFILLTTLIVSCNNDDTVVEEQTCEMTDLGITEAYKNPYPDNTNESHFYFDWQWVLKDDDNILVLIYELWENSSNVHTDEYIHYYYFNIDPELNCISFLNSKMVAAPNQLVNDGLGNHIYAYIFEGNNQNVELELQYFNINQSVVGKLNFEQIARFFHVEFNEGNHRDLTELEIASGL